MACYWTSVGKGVRRGTANRGRPVLPAVGSLGQRIRSARLALGLSQATLGGGRYTATYISALERGRDRSPSPEAIAFLERRLKLERGALSAGGPQPLAEAITDALDLVTRSRRSDPVEVDVRRIVLRALSGALERVTGDR